MGLIYILVTATLVFIFIYNKVFDGNKFIKELSPIFRNIIEDDYEFLVRLRYEDEDIPKDKPSIFLPGLAAQLRLRAQLFFYPLLLL